MRWKPNTETKSTPGQACTDAPGAAGEDMLLAPERVVDVLPQQPRSFLTDVRPGTLVAALDTETHLVAQGYQWPRMVCTSMCGGVAGEDGRVTFGRPGLYTAGIRLLSFWEWLLRTPEVLLVFHNAPFDLLVIVEAFREHRGADAGEECLRWVFEALDAGRVRDTSLRAPLLDNAKGFLLEAERGYSLAALASPLGVLLDKSGDSFRLRYAEFQDGLDTVPVQQWPTAAVDYAAADALATACVWGTQQESAAKHKYVDGAGKTPGFPTPIPWLGGAVVDEVNQCRGALALALTAGRGIRTDPVAVEALQTRLQGKVATYVPEMEAIGILRQADGSVNLKRLQQLVELDAQSRGIPVPRGAPTAKMKEKAQARGERAIGNIRYDGDTLEGCGLEELQRYTQLTHARKLLDTYVPVLQRGVHEPICARYYPLMATGRCSCRKPNLQNQPREPGVRQCYIPRPGYLLSSCDYSVLEMRTFAQVCHVFGFKSHLREAFLQGRDPHNWFGALLLGVTYEHFCAAIEGKLGPEEKKRCKEMRQLAKAANFGYPGGLGANTFVSYAAGYRVHLTAAQSGALRAKWLAAWPEAVRYFAAISARLDQSADNTITIHQLYSGRRRGRCFYTQACNTTFQGLAADGAKTALYRVLREALLDRRSDLHGSYVVAFIHDELVGEHPEEHAAPAAARMAAVMVESMGLWTPDVPQVVEPALMRRWDKEASPVFDDEGRLVPWDAGSEAYVQT